MVQNKHDIRVLMQHIEAIRSNNNENLDNLNSINMLMVDNNNGRVKDERIASRVHRLEEKLGEVSDTIREMEDLLTER